MHLPRNPVSAPSLSMRTPRGRPLFLFDSDNGAGAGASSTSGNAGTGDQGTAAPAISFASQEDFDAVIEQRLSRERTKLQKTIDGLTAQVNELTGKGKGDDKGKGHGDGEKRYTQTEVETLIQEKWAPQISERDGRIAKLEGVMRDNAILRAAAGAIDPDQVARLLRDEIGFDPGGNLVVVEAEGEPRLSSKGKHIPAEDRVKEFLEANKHLVKGSGIPGVGSSNRNAATQAQGQKQDRSVDGATRALANAFRNQKLL